MAEGGGNNGGYDNTGNNDGKRKVGCEGEVDDDDGDDNDNGGVEIDDGNDANRDDGTSKTNCDDDADGGDGNSNNEQTESVAGNLAECNRSSKMEMRVGVMQ